MTSPKPKAKKKPMNPRIQKAWEEYFVDRNETAKNILIDNYQFLVKHIMKPFWHKKPYLLSHDDLLQAGNIGLIQAIERYTRDKNTLFETFAQMRIRGAILDEINSLDWTPRSVRKNIRDVIKAEDRLQSKGKEATIENVMEETGLSAEAIHKSKIQAARTYVLPINQDAMREIEVHYSENEPAGDDLFTRFSNEEVERESKDLWMSLMSSLTMQEQQVIVLRFYYEETMIKTARTLRISPNSVSALQTSAFDKIKEAFDGYGNEQS